MKKTLLTILIAVMGVAACSKSDLNAPANDPGMISAQLPTEDIPIRDLFHLWDSLYHLGSLDQYAYFHAMPDPSWQTIILMGKKETSGTHFGYNGLLFNKGLKYGEKLEVWVPINKISSISFDGKDSASVGGWNFYEYGVGGDLLPGALLEYKDVSDTSILITSPGTGTHIIQPVIMKSPRPKTLSTVVSANSAMGTVAGGGEYSKVSYQITATPKTGYAFEYWEVVGQRAGWESKMPDIRNINEATTFIILKYNHYPFTFKAHFKPANAAKITVQTTGAGTVSGSGYYNVNTPFTITATPAAGYEFNYWMKNSTWVSNQAKFTTSVATTDPVTYTAHFKQAVAAATFNINCMFGDGLNNESKIKYCQPDGNWKTENLVSGSRSYNVKGGTDVRVYVQMSALWADQVYCIYKGPDGSIRDLSSFDPSFIEYFDYQGVSGTYNITLRAETNDFREEFQ